MSNNSYHLVCVNYNTIHEDNYTLSCENDCPAFLQSSYLHDKLSIIDEHGLFKFMNWLPLKSSLVTTAAPVTYKSEKLGEYLGLDNLHISFNGYWPEQGAFVQSCSFKEYEAYPTLQRLKETKGGVVQVSSAGNTAQAFAHAAVKTGQQVIIVTPHSAKNRVWTLQQPSENIVYITIQGDYYDAIRLGKQITNSHSSVFVEGGARNVVRRDGMALVILDVAVRTNKLPDFYFQAVGSGTGGIAVFEMNQRLIMDVRFGNKLPNSFSHKIYPLHQW